jgi:hypothetical protein
MSIDRELAVAAFYDDVEPADAECRAADLPPRQPQCSATRRAPAWKTMPSTIIVCTDDQAISVDRLNHMADNTSGDIVRWARATAHSSPDRPASPRFSPTSCLPR